MIDRNINFVMRDGEFTTDTDTTHSWVGGAPVGFDSSGYVTADYATTGAIAYIGVAWHSQAEDIAAEGLSTVIYSPAKIMLKKGTAATNGTADAYSPWQEGLTYAVGQLLRPTQVVSVGVTYSVWTNATLTNLGAYFARIVEMEGSGSAPTSLTILLETIPVVAA